MLCLFWNQTGIPLVDCRYRLVIMWSCPGLGMSVVHCLPVKNRQNQYNPTFFDTHVAPQTAGWHPVSLRSWITALWFWLDRFTSCYTIFKLCCNIACTSYLPSWLYSSPQVSASAFTQSKTKLCHLPYHISAMHRFQSHITHISSIIYYEEIMLFYCSVEVNSICKSQAWCNFWSVHITVD